MIEIQCDRDQKPAKFGNIERISACCQDETTHGSSRALLGDELTISGSMGLRYGCIQSLFEPLQGNCFTSY